MGTSGIQDSVITHSKYRLLEKYMPGELECLKDSWECSRECVDSVLQSMD